MAPHRVEGMALYAEHCSGSLQPETDAPINSTATTIDLIWLRLPRSVAYRRRGGDRLGSPSVKRSVIPSGRDARCAGDADPRASLSPSRSPGAR